MQNHFNLFFYLEKVSNVLKHSFKIYLFSSKCLFSPKKEDFYGCVRGRHYMEFELLQKRQSDNFSWHIFMFNYILIIIYLTIYHRKFLSTKNAAIYC